MPVRVKLRTYNEGKFTLLEKMTFFVGCDVIKFAILGPLFYANSSFEGFLSPDHDRYAEPGFHEQLNFIALCLLYFELCGIHVSHIR